MDYRGGAFLLESDVDSPESSAMDEASFASSLPRASV